MDKSDRRILSGIYRDAAQVSEICRFGDMIGEETPRGMHIPQSNIDLLQSIASKPRRAVKKGYVITMIDVETRERVRVDSDEASVWNEYMWTDGNYGCDCNRSLHFARAHGKTISEARDEMLVCGEAFYAIEVHDLDGNLLFSDFAAHEAAIQADDLEAVVGQGL